MDSRKEQMLDVLPPNDLARTPLNVPAKLLMGPGPSNVSPRVSTALAQPVLGHMHPEFFKILDEVKDGMRYVFQTRNEWTLVVSGPGHLGMEAVLLNLLESHDKILVPLSGLWSTRAADVAKRQGNQVVTITNAKGSLAPVFSLEEIRNALEKHRPQVLFMVHSESSTGVMQPLEGLGSLCRRYNCLLVVDGVASIGGVPFFMDRWEIDAVYTGSQKVLGAPSGLSPVSFGPRAVLKIQQRKTSIRSFLLDMTLLSQYWGCIRNSMRPYHHTPPVNSLVALRESLSILCSEGLENVWKRHAVCTHRLYRGIEHLGLHFFVSDVNNRLPTVTTIVVPTGVDWKRVSMYAMNKYAVEIAGGLGETAGLVFRIGVMGYNAEPENVDRVLDALKDGLTFVKFSNRL